jgi:type II secretory pathway pseudopilin PulG
MNKKMKNWLAYMCCFIPARPASQRGAMFGMDARIALIIAAILAAAGGITFMSRLERSNVDKAEGSVAKLRDGVSKYYQTISINQLPENLSLVFEQNMIDDPSLKADPWGNPWYYNMASADLDLEGTPITVHYAVIYSGGKDGVADSANLVSADDYASWQTAGDDVGIKLSTRDIEVSRKAEFLDRARLIVDKLEATESAAYIEAQTACTGTTDVPAWCTDYEGKNYTQFNYYPSSSLDETSGAISYLRNILSKPVYQSGDENDMQQLMLDLGLPALYAKDPWGRVLSYHSNITERTDPPFASSICFGFGEDCFARARQ